MAQKASKRRGREGPAPITTTTNHCSKKNADHQLSALVPVSIGHTKYWTLDDGHSGPCTLDTVDIGHSGHWTLDTNNHMSLTAAPVISVTSNVTSLLSQNVSHRLNYDETTDGSHCLAHPYLASRREYVIEEFHPLTRQRRARETSQRFRSASACRLILHHPTRAQRSLAFTCCDPISTSLGGTAS